MIDTVHLQIPRSIDDTKKIVQQLDELTKKIEDAKDLAMVIYLWEFEHAYTNELALANS